MKVTTQYLLTEEELNHIIYHIIEQFDGYNEHKKAWVEESKWAVGFALNGCMENHEESDGDTD